jgi:renalase
MMNIAIIGAGCSGLAAAHTLRDAGHSVVVFEQDRAPGGRATTRKRDGFIYDHGAQYIKRGSPASVAFISERFLAPDLIDIDKPVWIFDGAGRIQEGDPEQNAEPKWCYRSGLSALAERMTAGLDIRYGTTIARLQQGSPGWQLFDAAGNMVGDCQRLLITIPALQALALADASRMEGALQEAIRAQLSPARYNPLLSVALGYRPRPATRPYYALVNSDKAHAISWLAWEHEKAPERAPGDAGLLIAQMAPGYSEQRWHVPDADTYRDVAQRVASLIDEDLPAPCFTDITRWRYALPSTKAAAALNAATLPAGLAFCGDGFVGGRVHLAIEHGIITGQQLI